MYTIITSFNQKYWDEVAKENSKFLDKNWPLSSDIIFYHELDQIPDNNLSSRVSWIDLYQSCPELSEFVNRWKDHPKANGKNGKKFRYNAVKFVHKTFAIWHQAKLKKDGWLIWLDCDATLHKPIDERFIKDVFIQEKLICYVGRPGKYSECGFLCFNLNHDKTRKFLQEWEDLYLSGEFINLPETHDSYTFDYVRIKWNENNLFHNLNGRAITDKNPFSQSVIGGYLDHSKGKDKSKQLEKLKQRRKI
jgi:hypothetical protein